MREPASALLRAQADTQEGGPSCSASAWMASLDSLLQRTRRRGGRRELVFLGGAVERGRQGDTLSTPAWEQTKGIDWAAQRS
jgi:hypothetical protein